jgi:integrase/recombinase XerD
VKTSETIKRYLESCRARNLSAKTIAWYGWLLGKYCRTYKELPTDPAAVEKFLATVPGGDETRHGYYRALRALYNWTCGTEKKPGRYKLPSPMTKVLAPRRKKKTRWYLSTTELGWLMATPLSPRDRTLVMVLIDTGIRIGEALNLAREDVQKDTLLVDGKTGPREVPVSPETREKLMELAAKGFVFQGVKGRMTHSGAYRTVRLALRRAGIPAKKWGPHTLRHTFGRHYILAGGDLVSLQRILGHTNIKTTQIYAEMDLRDITLQHHRFTPLKLALDGAQAIFWGRAAVENVTLAEEKGPRR